MQKFISLYAMTIIAVSGCGAGPSALDRAGTMVAQTVAAAPPTDTPGPTATALPTGTSAPKLTVTPNIALTTTGEAFRVSSELDVWVGSNSGIPYRDGYLGWKQNEPVTINMSGPQKDAGILQSISENINATNFIFKSNVTWEASGVLICGLAFRAEPELGKGKQYQFRFLRLSGLPAYAIEMFEFGRFRNTISQVKFSDGLDIANDAANEFVLTAQNEEFTVFINGKQQGHFYDASKQRHDGLLAFVGWQDSGQGSCKFEDSWLWILP